MIGWARRGRVGALADSSCRALPLLCAGALLVLLTRAPLTPASAAPVIVGAGYLAALLALWLNRDHPWIPAVFLGAALNAAAILANGGRMPVPGTVLPPLSYLGDILRVELAGRGAIMSPGDVFMAVGVAGFVQAVMCRPLERSEKRRTRVRD